MEQTVYFVDRAMRRVFAAAKMVSKSHLAKLAGVPESTLRDLTRGEWTPTATTLRKLEAAAVEIGRGQNGRRGQPARRGKS